jgi:predicted methyltransferase
MAVTQDNSSNIISAYNKYKECLSEAERVIYREPPYAVVSLKKFRSRFLKTITDKSIPRHDNMLDIWMDIKNSDFEQAKLKMNTLQNHINELEDKVQSIKEQKEVAQVDVTRQKFDYFPFINALFTKSYQRQLLDSQPPPPPKTKKRGRTPKESIKSPKRPAKRRKSAGTT